jgi:tRNA pseudouridine38-40 synthase
MPRFALGIEYDGSAFRGWQVQRHARSIQGEIERALTIVADHPVEVHAAGRTDAGVHAVAQVVHFDADVDRGERGWVLGANVNLPEQISALWLRAVPDDFHARYAAIERRYRYLILNRPARPAIARHHAAWVREPLDDARMHDAAQVLVGEHDFSAFRAAECQSRTPVRRLATISVRRAGGQVQIEVAANAFLHHMVRNIVGTLIAVGRGARPAGWVQEVLIGRDRRLGGVTAPPQGLYLWAIRYPDAFGLPSGPQHDALPADLPRPP